MKFIPRFFKVLLYSTFSAVAAVSAAETGAPDAIAVDQNWQLFLDNYIIDRNKRKIAALLGSPEVKQAFASMLIGAFSHD